MTALQCKPFNEVTRGIYPQLWIGQIGSASVRQLHASTGLWPLPPNLAAPGLNVTVVTVFYDSQGKLHLVSHVIQQFVCLSVCHMTAWLCLFVSPSACLSVWPSICCPSFSVCLAAYLSVCLSVSVWLFVCLSVCLIVFAYLPFCPSACLSVCLCMCPSVCLCLIIFLPVCLPFCPFMYLSVCMCPSVCLSFCVWLIFCLSVCLSAFLSVYVSVCMCPSVCLSFCLIISLPVCLSACQPNCPLLCANLSRFVYLCPSSWKNLLSSRLMPAFRDPQLVAENSSSSGTDCVSRVQIPIVDVTVHQNFLRKRDENHQASLAAQENSTCVSQPPPAPRPLTERTCPFAKIRFEAPYDITLSRKCEYRFEPAVQLDGSLVQTQASVLDYWLSVERTFSQECGGVNDTSNRDTLKDKSPAHIHLGRSEKYRFVFFLYLNMEYSVGKSLSLSFYL